VNDSGLGSAEEVLQTIGRLNPEDRRWILSNLPPPARARLAALTAARPRAGDAASTESVAEAVVTLNTAGAARVVEFLYTEPAWLVQSVVFARDWPWRKNVLQRLPATLRLEVARLQRSGAKLAPAAGQFLLRSLAQRIDTAGGDAQHGESRFESLVKRFGRGGVAR
jgi:hypothetical protein